MFGEKFFKSTTQVPSTGSKHKSEVQHAIQFLQKVIPAVAPAVPAPAPIND